VPDYAQAIISVGAVVIAIGAIWKAPYVRRPAAYVARRLIGDPVSVWFRGMLRDEATHVITTELKQPNGGSSIPDLSRQLTAVETRLVEQGSYIHNEIHRLNGQVGPVWRDYAIRMGVDPEKLPPPKPSPNPFEEEP
jgi:hypothetical protein